MLRTQVSISNSTYFELDVRINVAMTDDVAATSCEPLNVKVANGQSIDLCDDL